MISSAIFTLMYLNLRFGSTSASDVSSRLGCFQIMIFGFLRFYHGYDPIHDPNHLILVAASSSRDLVSTHSRDLFRAENVTSIWGINPGHDLKKLIGRIFVGRI